MASSILPVLLPLLVSPDAARVEGTILRARMLDESGVALVSREVWYGIECDEPVPDARASTGYVGGTARTDASGILSFELDTSRNIAVARTLRLTLAERDLADPGRGTDTSSPSAVLCMLDEPAQPPRIRPPYAERALPARFSSGEEDLGDQWLYPPGSPARFAGLDDAGLCSRYLDVLAIVARTNISRSETIEELLCELVRRATPRCESFVAARLERAHRGLSGLGFRGDLPGLALLTALRRIQHRPDPVVITVNSEQAVEATFPRFPTVALALRNEDSAGATVSLVPALLVYGLDGSGPLGEALRVSRCAPRRFDGGGPPAALAPGDELPTTLAAASWLRMNSPGEYRLRVSLLPGTNPLLERDLRGHIALQSQELRLILRPLRIRLSRAERDQHLSWLRAIGVEKTVVVLTHDALAEPVDPMPRPPGKWSGPADDPEDRLYRAGLLTLPALFDALDDPALDSLHRAWAVAMLWNLTGVREGGYQGVGRIRACARWPTLRSDGPIPASNDGYRSEPLDEARLARTIERWRPYRSFLEIEWTD